MPFLELLDGLIEQLVARQEEPIAFDHDCREGICGACGMVINGRPHGPRRATTTCQLHLRSFADGVELWIEPWRAAAFPVLKDLVVDRSAFDRVIQAGGVLSVRPRTAPPTHSPLVPKPHPALPPAALASWAAPADCWGAAASSGESFTPRRRSSPLRPSLHGTPRKMPDTPYSPCTQAAHGRMRRLSRTIASTICVTAAEGA